jgi:hypothetical protein
MNKSRKSANLVSDNNIFVDIENDKVGIGTTLPLFKLDVSGDLNFTGTLNQNGSSFVASRWTSGTGDNIYRLNGNIGIGTTNPSEKLHVSGNILATGDINSNSDIKLKTNIKTLTNSLDKVLQMRGVEFDRIDIEGKHQIGFIAQEIEEIVPDVVSESNDIKSVSYGNITAILVEAIKEQQTQINTLKEQIENLKNER